MLLRGSLEGIWQTIPTSPTRGLGRAVPPAPGLEAMNNKASCQVCCVTGMDMWEGNGSYVGMQPTAVMKQFALQHDPVAILPTQARS